MVDMTIKEVGRRGGSVKSDSKTRTARENGRLGGRPQKPLIDIECTCGASLFMAGHKSTCLRGRAIKRREGAKK